MVMADPAPPGQPDALHNQAPVHSPPEPPLLAATSPSVTRLRPIRDIRLRRLMGVSAWALALGSSGFVLGAIALIRMMGDVPGWFEWAFGATGVFGLALIIAAFVTVRYQLVPWLLLGASTVTFVVGVVLLGSV
jgi:hypothetical protein